jgi:hypothetical protein
MLDRGGSTQQESLGRLDSGGRSATLLPHLREPVDRRNRLDLLARITAVAAGLAVLAALPLKLYTASFGSRVALGIHVTAWGQVTRFGPDPSAFIDYHAPVYGYALAGAAGVVVLTAWTVPRCATLGLAVLAGCAAVLFIDVRNLGEQPGAHVTMGPLLPVITGAVTLALLARLATWARRTAPLSTASS